MGLLSNRIGKETLKAGDHIYSWRAKGAYAHHGIYAGDDKVIHFTRGRGQEAGTGTSIDVLLVSSSPITSTRACLLCSSYQVPAATETNGVMSSCLSCFLPGGGLYRFEYAVSTAFFLAKVRGGTCTRATADPDEVVVHRARYLLKHGFRDYNLFKNNCEDFAIYCKTGLLAAEQGSVGIGQSGQAVSALASGVSVISVMKIAALATAVTRFVGSNRLTVLEEEVEDKGQNKEEEEDQTDGQESGHEQAVSPSIKVIAVAASIITAAIALPVVYCVTRHRGDIGNRRDVQIVEVENINQLETPGHKSKLRP